MKTFLDHSLFFNVIREKVLNAKEDLPCHKLLISVFIDYFNSRIIEDYTRATAHLNKTKNSIISVINYCYGHHFKTDKIPENPIELKKSILQKEECHKFLKWTKNYRREYKLNEADILALAEVDFIYSLASFMFSKRNIEPASYFNRFLFIYPYEKESNLNNSQVKEWKENHAKFFDFIKQDKDANEADQDMARDWYKELVEKSDFSDFSEEDLSLFFKEALVAFGNKTSKKKGCFAGYVTPLKNLLCMGRYYNIIGLHTKYLQFEKGSSVVKTLSLLAHATWRSFLDLNPIFDLEKIKEKEKIQACITLDEDIFKKKARKFSIKDLKKQGSYGEIITLSNKQDIDIYENTISQISLPEVAELKLQGASFNEAMEIILPDILSKSGVSNFLKGVSKKDINKHFEELGEKDYSEMPLQCYRAMFILSTAKAIPIQTSYDTYKNNHDAFNAVDIKKLYQQVMTKMV
ncbi:hypothetical protein [Fibrobacter sp. UWB10]|uniref:hypothetical protein n=1 Tax=Fibrobacter sp. UWB10 TaxID=1896201 RepID=UPI0024B70E64|nr:hypothetical protein [Fibrobacter sp. UWB10]